MRVAFPFLLGCGLTLGIIPFWPNRNKTYEVFSEDRTLYFFKFRTEQELIGNKS